MNHYGGPRRKTRQRFSRAVPGTVDGSVAFSGLRLMALRAGTGTDRGDPTHFAATHPYADHPQWAYSASRKASLVPRAARAAVPSRPTPRIASNVTPIVDQGMGIPGFVTFLMAIAQPVENPARVATV